MGGDGFGMIQAHYIYCAVYFYYYYLKSTSDHQVLDPRGCRPLTYSIPGQVKFSSGAQNLLTTLNSSQHGEGNAEIPSPWLASRKDFQQCH